jgi:hypothetical protein
MDAHALSCFEAFNRSGTIGDLNAGIESARLLTHETPETHPNYAGLLNNLGVMVQTRFEHLKRTEDQDEAIDLGLRALEATSASHPNYPIYLSTLSNKLQKRFEHRNSIDDLESAINFGRRAREFIFNRSIERPECQTGKAARGDGKPRGSAGSDQMG